MEQLLADNIQVSVVAKGLKLVQLKTKNVTCRDSLLMLNCSLDVASRLFDAPQAKGYFPHALNSLSTFSTVYSRIPDRKHFGRMCGDRLIAFNKWYDQYTGEYDMAARCIEYCRLDVQALAVCCYRFKEMTIKMCGLDCFATAATIASFTQSVFLTHHLHHHIQVLGDANDTLIGGAKQNSMLAIKYLSWLAHRSGQNIHHAGNGREQVLMGARVDGFCAETNTVYQCHGCIWHGCAQCTQKIRNQRSPFAAYTFNELYQRTLARSRQLASNYNVCEIWECEIAMQLREDETMRQHFAGQRTPTTFQLRNALYGGRLVDLLIFDPQLHHFHRLHFRVEVFSLHCKVSGNARIRVFDVTS
jgi:G:T-mismatch repair DNA endonuclease (very short patch repair protein)